MPSRLATRPVRDVGPRPFSAEWVANPTPPPATKPPLTLPSWIPDEGTLSAGLVLLVTLAIALIAVNGAMPRFAAGGPPEQEAPAALPVQSAGTPAAGLAAADETVTPPADAEAPQAAFAAQAPVEPASAGTPAFVPVPAPTIAPPPAGMPGAIFPANRILAYYGHPHDPNMGILGEYPKEELLRLLRQEAANYQAVDPTKPVLPAFELIATVAQRTPGADGTYILDTDLETLTEYADFAEANGALVFLDLQIGRGTVVAEIEKVRPLLERPHVHLALDPEFAVAEGETPGEYIGSLDAESIRYAQQTLADIVSEQGLPPKILIVHQFREDMIANKLSLGPVDGVQLVIDADGYGAPELKVDVYNILVRDEPVGFAGVKLFYKQDVPLMTPAEILGLTPSPDLIIYQ
jgi:hypothetical protein